MPEITLQDLATHVGVITTSDAEELDELLIDFLVAAWPSRTSQDN